MGKWLLVYLFLEAFNVSFQPIYLIKKRMVDIQSSSNVLFTICNSTITSAVGDNAFQEYSVFILTGDEIGKCSKFDRKNKRMDNLYFKKFDMDDMYQNLAIVLRLIFVLSCSQASIEWGFSLNKGVLNNNMTELSIISLRFVKDHLRILKVGVSEVTITLNVIKSVALSNSRYILSC